MQHYPAEAAQDWGVDTSDSAQDMGVAVGELSILEDIQAGVREVARDTCRGSAAALLNWRSGRVKKRRLEPSGWKLCLYVGEPTQIKGVNRVRSVSDAPRSRPPTPKDHVTVAPYHCCTNYVHTSKLV